MEVSAASNVQAAISSTQASDAKRAQFQMMLLKRSLEEQQRQAADITRLIEGKGTVVDIRI